MFKFVNVDQLSDKMVKDLLKESLICDVSKYFNLLNIRMVMLKSKGTKILSVGRYDTAYSIKTIFNLVDEINVVYFDLLILLHYHRILKVNNCVYCIGGKTSSFLCSNKVFGLNLNEADMKWNEIAEMKNERCGHGAAMFYHVLVVCGGWDGKNYISSSEAYDTELNEWNRMSLLKQNT